MDRIEKEISALVELYFREVLPNRARNVKLPGRKCNPTIMYTFLGFELKAGRKRITCPDISTARYLRIFTELGLSEVLIPYDPTRTARILPSLERHFFKIKELLIEKQLREPEHRTALRKIYRQIRKHLRQNGGSSHNSAGGERRQ